MFAATTEDGVELSSGQRRDCGTEVTGPGNAQAQKKAGTGRPTPALSDHMVYFKHNRQPPVLESKLL